VVNGKPDVLVHVEGLDVFERQLALLVEPLVNLWEQLVTIPTGSVTYVPLSSRTWRRGS
jgi:hypothetical protein